MRTKHDKKRAKGGQRDKKARGGKERKERTAGGQGQAAHQKKDKDKDTVLTGVASDWLASFFRRDNPNSALLLQLQKEARPARLTPLLSNHSSPRLPVRRQASKNHGQKGGQSRVVSAQHLEEPLETKGVTAESSHPNIQKSHGGHKAKSPQPSSQSKGK